MPSNHADAYTFANTNGFAKTNTYCDANSNTYGDTNRYSNADSDSYGYINGDSQCDSDSNTDAYANRNSERYTEGYFNTPGSTHASASPSLEIEVVT